MSPVSWTDSLKQTVTALETRLKADKKRPPRIALLGIGQELRGDDAAGLAVAQGLRPFAQANFLVIEAGHAPENCTGILRRFVPDLVLLVDCAQLDAPPGTIRWLPWQETTGLSATTHTLPPYMLARYLTTDLNCDVALIGIQPLGNKLDTSFSPPVAEAIEEIVRALTSQELSSGLADKMLTGRMVNPLL